MAAAHWASHCTAVRAELLATSANDMPQDHLGYLIVNRSNCYDSLADALDHIENLAYKAEDS